MRSLFIILLFAAFLHASPNTAAAATYYLSPSGNDSAIGSATSPWKTISNAHSKVTSGDTVILKNGVYSGRGINMDIDITKSNTTWKAENKHQAIIDGGFGPSLLNGKWSNILNAFNPKCTFIKNGITYDYSYKQLLTIKASSVVIDGIHLRNSCGRGILVGDYVSNAVIRNNKIDWTLRSGIYIAHKSKNTQFVNNIVTRTSFDDVYNHYSGNGYAVNAQLLMGENTVVRGNIFAWIRGEICPNGAKNLLFEENVVVGNKTNLYSGLSVGIIARNNSFIGPETDNLAGTHWELPWTNDQNRLWDMTSRNEIEDRWVSYSTNLEGLHLYNNIMVNNAIIFDGYHRRGGTTNYSTNTTNVYFGHNTVIAGENTFKLLQIAFSPYEGKNSIITGIFENNIFDTRNNPTARISAGIDSNDSLVFRNNIWPTNVSSSVKGSGDVYSNDPGMVNALAAINIPIPGIGVAEVDMQALQQIANMNNYRLKQTSLAINKGSVAGTINGVTIPSLARSQDYFKMNRLGTPDIGAIEFTGTNPPTLPPSSPTPTNVPSQPTSTPTVSVKLPRFDIDSDTDWLDILLFLPRFALENQPQYDLNSSRIVDIFDFATSMLHFNK